MNYCARSCSLKSRSKSLNLIKENEPTVRDMRVECIEFRSELDVIIIYLTPIESIGRQIIIFFY